MRSIDWRSGCDVAGVEERHPANHIFSVYPHPTYVRANPAIRSYLGLHRGRRYRLAPFLRHETAPSQAPATLCFTKDTRYCRG
ncbi:hypothetical protein [Psychrobacter lutiphocae]|uniref:hypothetical protein n=1 Tax=Psychrobacter lutiphocae TaxID=540500 RepID=UPI0012E9FA39|nr:hypothetical protein [Psychrobacter lutiphocae]